MQVGRTISGLFFFPAKACLDKKKLELGVTVAQQARWAGAQGTTKPHQSQQVMAGWLRAGLALCLQFANDQPNQFRTYAIVTPGPIRLTKGVPSQARPGQAKPSEPRAQKG